MELWTSLVLENMLPSIALYFSGRLALRGSLVEDSEKRFKVYEVRTLRVAQTADRFDASQPVGCH
jgi:hypothetical protein